MGAAGGSTFSVAVCVTEHVLCMCVCMYTPGWASVTGQEGSWDGAAGEGDCS